MVFSKAGRIGRILTLTLVALALAAGAAQASTRQFSIIEDDAVFLGLTGRSPDAALAESKGLGADAVRVVVSWRRAAPYSANRTLPAGIDASDPRAGYDWSGPDAAVSRARAHGLKVILDLSPSIPYWGSSEPNRCPHPIGGHPKLGLGCFWKPDARKFGRFATAAARHYKGRVAFYSIWNEPNLENYLYPQSQKTKSGTVDFAAKRFRELWIAGHRSIARVEPKMGKRVLFGETAAISSPRDTLYSALCLNRRGRPYTGAMKRLQGCSKPAKLPIAGLAVHPYNQSALGNVFTRSPTGASLTMAYLSRATRLLKVAEKYKRVPKGRGIYVTETGFQSLPANRRGLSLISQARALNESDRLFYGDPRVRSTAQFELFDVPDEGGQDIFNTGLRLQDGTAKPSFAAYRLPLVVSRLGRKGTEVWGQVRPARGRARAVISVSRSAKGPFKRLRSVRTNSAGYYRFVTRRKGASGLRYRASWKRFQSRVAQPGRAIRYRR